MAATDSAPRDLTGPADQNLDNPKPKSPAGSNSRQERFAQTFANVVAVLMRDTRYRKLSIAELEWLVLPPIMSGQWRLARSDAQTAPDNAGDAHGRGGPIAVPVAVVLWANVSKEIDSRFRESVNKPICLRPTEWLSGDFGWIVAAAGNPRAVPKLLENLAETEFQGRDVSFRAGTHGGPPKIVTLQHWVETSEKSIKGQSI